MHKAQGSQAKNVVLYLNSKDRATRSILYTAITRGRKLVLLMGVPYAVDQAIMTNTVRERRTSLAERLNAGGAES